MADTYTPTPEDHALWDLADGLLELLNIEDLNPHGLTEQIADRLRPWLAARDAETRRQALEEAAAWAEMADYDDADGAPDWDLGFLNGRQNAAERIRTLAEVND